MYKMGPQTTWKPWGAPGKGVAFKVACVLHDLQTITITYHSHNTLEAAENLLPVQKKYRDRAGSRCSLVSTHEAMHLRHHEAEKHITARETPAFVFKKPIL